MLNGLLQYSLARISSLQYFYESVLDSIKEKSIDGMDKNRFGCKLDEYFSFITSENGPPDDEAFTELFKDCIENVEIQEIKKDPDGATHVFYEINNRDELIEKGYELDTRTAKISFMKYYDMPVIHGSNTIIMLITRFEEFISNLLTEIYKLYPGKYLDNQKISFSEICGNGIEDVRKCIITREVDAIMRASYEDWFKIFREHNIDLKKCESEIENLKELYARRNITVHNSGIVNTTYKKAVPNSSANIGDELTIGRSYIRKAFSSIKTIIFIIMIEAVKLENEKKATYLTRIFLSSFDELTAGNYDICEKIFNALSSNKYADEQTKKYSTINGWIARKELYGLDNIRDEVNSFDVSALKDEFSLAKELLLDNYENAVAILEDMFNSGMITFSEIKEWPLFLNFRKTKHYIDFLERHPEDANTESCEVDSKSLIKDNDIDEEPQICALNELVTNEA